MNSRVLIPEDKRTLHLHDREMQFLFIRKSQTMSTYERLFLNEIRDGVDRMLNPIESIDKQIEAMEASLSNGF